MVLRQRPDSYSRKCKCYWLRLSAVVLLTTHALRQAKLHTTKVLKEALKGFVSQQADTIASLTQQLEEAKKQAVEDPSHDVRPPIYLEWVQVLYH